MQEQHRILRLNALLQKELGRFLLEEIEFPEGAFVTVTRASAMSDLQHARVYISVIPEDKSKEVLRILNRNIFSIQQELNKELRMRPIPKIEWVLDEHLTEVQRVEELLEQVKEKE